MVWRILLARCFPERAEGSPSLSGIRGWPLPSLARMTASVHPRVVVEGTWLGLTPGVLPAVPAPE